MNLRTIPIDQLQPAPYNPRVDLQPDSPAYKRLERSLDEFSLVQPIVWNEKTEYVVSGHQRLKILRAQGATESEVVVVSLSVEREKALNITLNNSQVAGDWDPAKLVDLVAELQELPNFDATLTGFDPKDIDDLLMLPDPNFQPDDDAANTPDVVTVTVEVRPEDWDDVRPEFDRIIAQWELTTHVKMPP